jgi:DNA-binding transcriptional MocR family regulator
VLWLELPGTVDARTLFGAAIAKGICFAPGDVFSATKGHRNCLRLSCGHHWDERIEASIGVLGDMAKEAMTS